MTDTRPVDMCLGSLRFYPDYAGPAQRFQRYAPGLRERGIQMRVLSGVWGTNAATSAEGGATLTDIEVQGIPIRRVPLADPHRRDFMHYRYFQSLAEHCTTIPRPDVLQLLNAWSWSPPWLRRIRRAGVPIVLTQTMMRDPSIGAIKNFAWSLPLRSMDRIVVSTGVMRYEIRALGVRTPIAIIPNGVDLGRFRPCASPDERRALRARLGLEQDAELVTFVGGFLSRRKGLDVLVEAWNRLAPSRPRARLVLVGPHLNTLRPEGPQADFLRQLREGLRRGGAEDRVVFTGEVEAVEDYFRAADVFVFPSRREGMPNVVAEAFACGVASVLTPFIGLPTEFGQAGREYVLSDREPEALATAVAGLLDDPDARAGFGARARHWTENELDVEISLDRYAEMYQTLIARRRP